MSYLAIILLVCALYLGAMAAFCFWSREGVGYAMGAVLSYIAFDALRSLYHLCDLGGCV